MSLKKISLGLMVLAATLVSQRLAVAANVAEIDGQYEVSAITFQIKNQPGSCGWDMGANQCNAQAGTGHVVKGHACWNTAEGHTVQCTIE